MTSEKRVFLQLIHTGDIHTGGKTELVFEEEWGECEQRCSERVRKTLRKNQGTKVKDIRETVCDSFWRLCGEKGGWEGDEAKQPRPWILRQVFWVSFFCWQ